MEPENLLPPTEIPMDALSEDALNGVIINFIEREGTDYGAIEASHEIKIEQIRRQLKKGDIKIVFDPNSETVSIVTKRDWVKLKSESAPNDQ